VCTNFSVSGCFIQCCGAIVYLPYVGVGPIDLNQTSQRGGNRGQYYTTLILASYAHLRTLRAKVT
jgi:hypothetical protein